MFAESHYTACLVARLRPARFGCHFAHQDGGESFELRVGVCFFALFYGASDPGFSARSSSGPVCFFSDASAPPGSKLFFPGVWGFLHVELRVLAPADSGARLFHSAETLPDIGSAAVSINHTLIVPIRFVHNRVHSNTPKDLFRSVIDSDRYSYMVCIQLVYNIIYYVYTFTC